MDIHILFTQTSADGHLDYLHLLLIVNSIMNIHLQVFV